MSEFSTFYLFATALAVGIASMLPFVPFEQVGRRFYVLMSLIAVGFIALAVVDRGLDVHYGLFAFAGLMIAYNVVLPPAPRVDPGVSREERSRDRSASRTLANGLLLLAIVAGVVGLAGDSLAHAEHLETRAGLEILTVATALSTAAFLGAAVVAMTLGHWYLVLHGASFGPLRRLTVILAIAILARIFTSLGASYWQGHVVEAATSAGLTRFLLGDGVFVIARWLFGLAAPLILVRLVWGCLRIESNQSATGILYVIVAFGILGELLAKHYQVSGWIL
ncbi:MAG TPA: hypothetical protein VK116_17295 [Planctomycetota bacterium]|nr:hypothetical protein [Planctomycetota bacterium]